MQYLLCGIDYCKNKFFIWKRRPELRIAIYNISRLIERSVVHVINTVHVEIIRKKALVNRISRNFIFIFSNYFVTFPTNSC